MITKIVSGGQTGVDQAALLVALQLRIPHGGWCPKGRKSELGLGTIPFCYTLTETISADYSERTILNLQDSDGTLIFVPKLPLSVTDGTILTIEQAKTLRKPYLVIDLSCYQGPDEIVSWAEENNIKTLNIAGPRESQSKGIFEHCSTIVFPNLFESLFTGKLKKERSASALEDFPSPP
jgi:hypothetical protein